MQRAKIAKYIATSKLILIRSSLSRLDWFKSRLAR